jgi:hypothetical protein
MAKEKEIGLMIYNLTALSFYLIKTAAYTDLVLKFPIIKTE